MNFDFNLSAKSPKSMTDGLITLNSTMPKLRAWARILDTFERESDNFPKFEFDYSYQGSKVLQSYTSSFADWYSYEYHLKNVYFCI